jgi:hypothetical protein
MTREGVRVKLSLDLHADGTGAWSVEAYDLPGSKAPSVRFPQRTADLTAGPSDRTAGVTRLVFTGALVTSLAGRVVGESWPVMYVSVYQARDRAAMIEFERRIAPRYQDYYTQHGSFYAGLFDVAGLAGAYLGELIAVNRPLSAAKDFAANHQGPADIAAIEDECRTLQARDLPRYLFWLERQP